MPVREYYWDGTQWTSSGTGGGSSSPTLADLRAARTALTPGTYIPGPEFTANSVGIYGESFIEDTWDPGTSGGTFKPTTPQTIENTLFMGNVVGTAAMGTVTFKNCMFVGNKPELVQAMNATSPNAAYDFGSGATNYTVGQFVFEDCTFDNSWWYRNGLSNWWDTTQVFQEVVGYHGTNATLRRCLITGFVDSVNYALGNLDYSQGSMLIDASRLGGNYYGANPGRVNDTIPHTHSDGWQVGTGGNMETRYSYIGGPLVQSELNLTGGVTSGAANAAFMIQQEQSSAASVQVVNIAIHDNWLAGGAATVNLNYKNSNTLSSVSITNNRIMKHNTSYNGNGYYILKTSGVAASISGNVVWELDGSIFGNGTAAPIATV